jgi:hypothetical protein
LLDFNRTSAERFSLSIFLLLLANGGEEIKCVADWNLIQPDLSLKFFSISPGSPAFRPAGDLRCHVFFDNCQTSPAKLLRLLVMAPRPAELG